MSGHGGQAGFSSFGGQGFSSYGGQAGFSSYGGQSGLKHYTAPVLTYSAPVVAKVQAAPVATHSYSQSSFSGYAYKAPEKVTKLAITPSISYSLDSQKGHLGHAAGQSSQSFALGYSYAVPVTKLAAATHVVKADAEHVVQPTYTSYSSGSDYAAGSQATKYVAAPLVKAYAPAITKVVVAPQQHAASYGHQTYQASYHGSSATGSGSQGGGHYTAFVTPVVKSSHKAEHKPIKIKHSEYYVSIISVI